MDEVVAAHKDSKKDDNDFPGGKNRPCPRGTADMTACDAIGSEEEVEAEPAILNKEKQSGSNSSEKGIFIQFSFDKLQTVTIFLKFKTFPVHCFYCFYGDYGLVAAVVCFFVLLLEDVVFHLN